MAKRKNIQPTETADSNEAKTGDEKKAKPERLAIPYPNMKMAEFHLVGTSPYVQHAFSEKARKELVRTQELGSEQAKKTKRKKDPKDFHQQYLDAMHKSTEGWYGMPAPGFRNAMISACRTVGFTMTQAKLCLFVEADGLDADDGTGLVRIIKGEPEYHEAAVRLATGVVDVRARPMWREWEAILRVKYDADQFTAQDVANLVLRVGIQVGIGEGRHDSKKSAGMGWGQFTFKEATGEQASAA